LKILKLPIHTLQQVESLVGKKNWEVPEGLVSSFLKRRTFDIPEFEGGNAPPLSRPILFVHGLGANYTSYGAKPAINVEGKGFSAERELVRAYKGGSAPDVIARKNKLDMSYDPNYPERGINTNGIYFWNAKSEDLMNPEYNESGASQARDIQLTIESMLDRHFGSAWKSDSTLKFDLVCHSQGCVSIRDMMHNNSVVVDKSLSNPLNHLNRILNINAPHQGSILATSPDDIRADYLEYWGVADFKEGLLSENMEGHGLLSGTIELDALGTATSVTVGAIVGGAAGSIFGPLGAGIGGALGAFIGGWFASEAEANFNLQGAYLGPYNYTWGIDYLFGSASGEDELEDFTDSIRSKVMEMEGAASHLSNNSPWLLSLNLGGPLRNGYPYLPNGKPVRMSIFSSQGLERLESEILFGLAEAINLKCGGNEDCDISSEYFISEGVNFAENKVNSFPLISAELDLSGDFLQILKDFRGQWLANSDIAVQKESQPTLRKQETILFIYYLTLTIH
jgi:hypothetical protein